jgi:Tol biopolymer transport system component/tRNA A-37 threonylcarbamoyl transferase component Bud32
MRQPTHADRSPSPADPAASGQAPAGGEVVGHYEILSEIGRGGMGVVYRARDLKLDRIVALKTPLPGHTSDQDRRRFLREAQAVARLSHPHIAPVFEVFEDGETLWVAMEFVTGSTLRRILWDKGALPPLEVIRCGEGLADALREAHSHGVLHRDINPNNIMLTEGGRPLLLDFGLAQVLPVAGPEGETTTQTQAHTTTTSNPFAGTPAYMPPEQILGEPLGVRSDLFSLGAVLYEMCTGHPAFSAPDRAGLYEAILRKDPTPIAEFNSSIPAELDRIVRKSLAKRADERYQTAADLLADLRALKRQTESGRDSMPLPPPSRLPWRAVIATAAVLLAIAVVGVLKFRPDTPPRGVPAQVTSVPGWETEPAVSPDGRSIAYASDESGNADIWIADARGGSTLRLTDDPASDRDPHWYPDGSAVAFVSSRSGHRSIWRVSRLGGPATMLVDDGDQPAISPDATRISFVRAGPNGLNRIFVARFDDLGHPTMVTGDGDGLWNHSGPAWSPDGRSICYAAARDLWVVLIGGHPARLTTNDEVDFEPVWSPNGRHVYFSSYREGTLALWRVAAGGGKPMRLTGGTGPERHPSLSADGTAMAYTTYVDDPDVVLRDMQTGVEQRLPGVRDEHAPVIAPDGSAVAFISDRIGGRFDLWIQPLAQDAPSGPPRRVTDHAGSVAQPAYSPDGRWIAYHRVVDGQRDVWIVPAAGGAPIRFTSDPAVDIHPTWSPDGSRIAFASERGGGSRIWIAPVTDGLPAGDAVQFTSGPWEDEAPSWSRDGASIAFIRHGPTGVADVWVQGVALRAVARRITTGADAGRIVWNGTSSVLLITGRWGGERLTLRQVPVDGGPALPMPGAPVLSANPAFVHFDLSKDGRLLVFARENPRGDVWLLRSQEKPY